MGISAGLLAAAFNGGIVAYACTKRVRAVYGFRYPLRARASSHRAQ